MMYVLPGMGADSGMYSQEWRELPDVRFIEWSGCEDLRSLEEVAAFLVDRYSISDGSVVLGTSLGGIVACEISMIVDLDNLILLSSAKSKEEVNSFLGFIHPLVDFAPIDFVQKAIGKYPTELNNVFGGCDAGFIRSMCKAIFQWEGLGDSGISPIRIHGSKDKVIPIPEGVDLVLDGGHLIAISHASDCIEFLRLQQVT